MWKFLEYILGRKPARTVAVEVHSYHADETSFRRAPQKPAAPVSVAPVSIPVATPVAVEVPEATVAVEAIAPPPPASLVLDEDGEMIQLAWSVVAGNLPEQIRSQLCRPPTSSETIRLPLDLLLPQLAHGSVSIRFEELVKRAPEGSIRPSELFGDLSVQLPLKNILEAIPAEKLPRRTRQVRPEIPNDEAAVWPEKNPAQYRWVSPKTGIPPSVVPPPAKSEEQEPLPPRRFTMPDEVSAAPATPEPEAPPEKEVSAPIRFVMPSGPLKAPEPLLAAAVEPELKPEPVEPAVSATNSNLADNAGLELPEVATDCVRFMFSELAPAAGGDAAQWMQALDGCCVDLPLEKLEASIRMGRVAFQWGALSGWIKPDGVARALGLPDDAWVDLPLMVVAPRFMEARRGKGRQRPAFTAENMPDLFQPERAEVVPPPVEATPPEPLLPTSGLRMAELRMAEPDSMPSPDEAVESHSEVPSVNGEETAFSGVEQESSQDGGAIPIEPPQMAADELAGSGPGEGLPQRAVIDIEFASFIGRMPEPIRRAMAPLGHAMLRMPVEETERALSAGCALFTWAQMMDWVHPATELIYVDLAPNALIELPLDAIVPDFMSRVGSPSKDRQSVEVPEDLPNLFEARSSSTESSSKQSAQKTVVARSFEEMFPEEAAEAIASGLLQPSPEVARSPEPAPSYEMPWSAAELVQSVLMLPGVAGAIVSTNDGFLVSGAMPTGYDKEGLAALMPQIAGGAADHISRLGFPALKHLCLTAGEAQLHIYPAGAACLTVLGSPGEQLPVAQLGEIAVELARQHQFA